MRPGTRGCADTKDPALLGCEEAALICSASFYFRLNDQDWKIGEILPQRPGFYLEEGWQKRNRESERLSRIDMEPSPPSRLTSTVKGL